jgi:hypothetical protein
MTQKNLDIRSKAKQEGIRLWAIGDSLGMSDANFSRLLRKEMDGETKKRIFSIIQELKSAELGQATVSK